MDTDDLSEKAYNGIIRQAEYFHHDLTLQFGVFASHCKDKNEYLNKALLLIGSFKKHPEVTMNEIFFENFSQTDNFLYVLKELEKSIKAIQKIPVDKRTYEEW